MERTDISPAAIAQKKEQMISLVVVHGFSRKQVARALGVATKTVSMWLREYGGMAELKKKYNDKNNLFKTAFIPVAMFGKRDKEYSYLYPAMMELYKKFTNAI